MLVWPTAREVILLRGGGTYTLRERGKLKRRGRWTNAAATVGRNLMLNVMFRGTTASTAWYCGLVDGSTATFAAADTMSSHTGWTENTGYSDATRRQWSPGAASGSVLSATAATFNLNATSTLYGVFVADSNTKGGTTGTLWATGAFDAAQAVVNGNTLDVTYETELQAVA